MQSQPDTFRSFVEVLARQLDGPPGRAGAVAAELHLSRYHFARVIAATAGEAPGAFRRRILLERAAHRLASTPLSIVEVALEAGYASHEGFTRAFARAFHRSPSAWRRAPASYLLHGPSGAHFHPPGGLRLRGESKVTSMDLIIRLVEHHTWLVGQFIERSREVPDAVLDQPVSLSVEGIDEDPTLRSLLSRLVGQMDMWNASMAGRDYDFEVERLETLDSMARRLATAGGTFLATVREVCEGARLDETFVDAVCEPPRVFTYGGMVAHVLTYAAHRRTLVVGALYSAGITDIADDPLVYLSATA